MHADAVMMTVSMPSMLIAVYLGQLFVRLTSATRNRPSSFP